MHASPAPEDVEEEEDEDEVGQGEVGEEACCCVGWEGGWCVGLWVGWWVRAYGPLVWAGPAVEEEEEEEEDGGTAAAAAVAVAGRAVGPPPAGLFPLFLPMASCGSLSVVCAWGRRWVGLVWGCKWVGDWTRGRKSLQLSNLLPLPPPLRLSRNNPCGVKHATYTSYTVQGARVVCLPSSICPYVALLFFLLNVASSIHRSYKLHCCCSFCMLVHLLALGITY